MLTITSPYVQIADLNGDPLDDGSIYIGTAGLNAETNPITVYWDAAGTQPAAQPIKTRSGVVARNGSPARVYVNAGAYSITVRDKMGRLLASELSISSSVDASGITDGTIEEVKLDAALAAKINGALQKSGGTMTGPIALPGNATNSLEALPKQQAESIAAAAVANRFQYSQPVVQVTTSGTAIDFTSIPTWAKRITGMLNGVSTNGSSAVTVQIGSGSVDVTGYAGSAGYTGTSSAAGVMVNGFATETASGAAVIRHGHFMLTHMGSNVWIFSSVQGRSDTAFMHIAGGSKTLSGVLDRLRITCTNGTDTFDAGSVGILIEG